MKNQFIFVFLILSVAGCCKNTISEKETYKIFSSVDYSFISQKDFYGRLKNADVVFFGEKHDDAFTHQREFDVFKNLSVKNSKIALALEMFERDVQEIIDSFLDNKISEEEFLQKSRPWSNYETDYKPIFVYAKENGIQVIGANIPRNLASVVSIFGEDSIFSLNGIENFFVKPFVKPEDYKKRFTDFFMSIQAGNPMSHMLSDNMFVSQLYKDATMAFSVNEFIKKNKDKKVYMLCGEFHSDYRQGIIQQLEMMNDKLKILTISVCGDSTEFDPAKADFIILK